MLKRLKNNPILKNVVVFFSGSILAIISAAIIQFFLPKILSVEDYGLYKSFTLYLSYTSLLHFGLKDGIYMALCAEQELNKPKNIIYYSALFFQQFLVLLIMLLVSFYFDFPVKLILLCLALTSFFFIINTYYDSLFQSQKKFKVVSSMKIFKELSFLILLIIIHFYYDESSINLILFSFLASVLLVFIFYSYKSRKLIGLKNPMLITKKDVLPVYKRGAALIMGNFGSQINANIDKLFISFFYSVKLFAYYSFGGMFFVLTNTFINSVATVLLPYLFNEYKNDLGRKYRQLMKLTSFFSIVLFFYLIVIFHFTKFFYSEYVTSIPIIASFYLGMVYNIKINIVQNNYLKSLNLDKEYIRNNYLILVLFIIIMASLYSFNIEITYFALCTSLMMYFRYRLNLKSINRELGEDKKYLIDDFLIFALGIVVFLYAKYVA